MIKKIVKLALGLFLSFLLLMVIAICVWIFSGDDGPEITHEESLLYEYVTKDGQRRPTFSVTVKHYDDGTALLESFGAQDSEGVRKKIMARFDTEADRGFFETYTDDNNRDFLNKGNLKIQKDAFGSYQCVFQKTEGQGTDRPVVAYLRPH